MEGKLAIVGTDGTASMTGKHNGCIRNLEELLHRPLQWVVCLLHTNELPLRHVFATLDGATSGPDTFAGPIGKKIQGPVSNWPVTQFKQVFVPISSFPKLPPHVIDDLSSDQYYAYKICLAIITGNFDDDLQYLEVGPVVHSRWLTLNCRILRYYVSLDEPPQNLEILVRISRHLETSTVFSGLSNRIQNDIIEAVAEVIRTDIRNDINKASFIVVEVDATTDVTQKPQISVIFRYVCEASYVAKEAFLGFDDVSDDRRASAIPQYVLGILQKLNSMEKLVAQTYDGAFVMSSELNGVQARIKEDVPEAMFLHCYAHKLNLVLLQSAKCMHECKTFFKTLEGLSAFFSKSTKRTHLLDNVVKRRLPSASPTR